MMSNGVGRYSLRHSPAYIRKESILEAKDAHGTWYPAKVIAVKGDKVHVHFCNWSSRFDTWYPVTSDCLRALKRVCNATRAPLEQNDQDLSPNIINKLSPSMGYQSTPVQFTIGSYVMAAWRNQYEYLAEVIAHRHRQGDKSEFRLRYVWDGVIEWTPMQRLRKATQFEIDYVQKFCRDHSGSRAGKTISECLPRSAVLKRNGQIKTNTKSPAATTITHSPSLSTRSHSKKEETGSADEAGSIKMLSPSTNSMISTTNSRVGSPLSPSFDGFEQDGMLYDKSVLQFHEACRKRRELKRQAVEIEEKYITPTKISPISVVSPPKTVESKTPPVQSSSPIKLEAEEVVYSKISHVSPLQQPKSLDVEPSEITSSPTACVVTPPNTEEKPFVTQSPVTHSLTSCTPPACPVSTSPTVRNRMKSSNHIKPRMDCSPTADQVSNNSSTATSYPCPHCPRHLRHLKLLSVHIANYHKEVTTKSIGGSFCSSRRHGINGLKKTTNAYIKGPNVNAHEARIVGNINALDIKSSTDSTISDEPERLLFCLPCNTRGHVCNSALSRLIQCQNCLCWMHRACYPFGSSSLSKRFTCDGCRLTTRPHRRSRADEVQACSVGAGNLEWDENEKEDGTQVDLVGIDISTAPNRASRNLLSEAANLLNWSCQLKPLVTTGWNLLSETKLPSPTSSKRPPPMVELASPQTSYRSSRIDAPMMMVDSKSADGIPAEDLGTPDDPVNRLYMELRAELDDVNTELPPSISSGQTISDTSHTPDCSSTPTNSQIVASTTTITNATIINNSHHHLSTTMHTASWAPCDVELDTTDPSVDSSQFLSGLLQELAPKVISELVDLGPDDDDPDIMAEECRSLILRRNITPLLSSQSSVLDDGEDGGFEAIVGDTPTKNLGATLLLAASGPRMINGGLQQQDVEEDCNENSHMLPTELTETVTPSVSLTSGFLTSQPRLVDSNSESIRTGEPPLVSDSSVYPSAGSDSTLPTQHATGDELSSTAYCSSSSNNNNTIVASSNAPSDLANVMHKSTIYSSINAAHLEPNFSSTGPTGTATLTPADMDWLTASSSGSNAVSFGLLFPPSSTNLRPAKTTTSLAAAAAPPPPISKDTDPSLPFGIHDSSSFALCLDTITDSLTVDDFSEAHRDLDRLDEDILAPLERTLSLMEAQMDAMAMQVDNISVDRDAHLPTSQHLLFPSPESSSPFCSSSSSFSLSPLPDDAIGPTQLPLHSTDSCSPRKDIRDGAPHTTSIMGQPTMGSIKTDRLLNGRRQTAQQLYLLNLSKRCATNRVMSKPKSIRGHAPTFARHSPSAVTRFRNDRS